MPYHVVKDGNQWCVEKADGSKRFGCHDTKSGANDQMAAMYASEPKASMRHLHLVGATGEIRTAQYDGRDHLVVPVVAMVEGVVCAVNSDVPEFVPAEELAETPQQWDGRGCFAGHPKDDGTQVTANTPRTLEKSFGVIFNTVSAKQILKTRRLELQAWLNPAKAEQVGPEAVDVIRRLRSGERVEVSVGCYVETEEKDGEFGGLEYHSVWHNIVSDHLAFLNVGQEGACSIEAGCGAPRVAVRHLITAEGLRRAYSTEGLVRVSLSPAMVEAAKALPESSMGYQRVDVKFADGQQFVDAKLFNGSEIELPQELVDLQIQAITFHNTAMLEVKMAGASSGVKAAATPTAPKPPSSPQPPGPHPSQPTGPQPSPTVPKRSLKERLASLFSMRNVAAGQSDVDLRRAIDTALRAIEPGYMGVDNVYPDGTDDLSEPHVIYSAMPGEDWITLRRTYTSDASGAVTLAKSAEQVEEVTSYVAAEEKPIAAASKPTIKAAGCGCKGDKVMALDKTKKAELIAALVTDANSGFIEGDEAVLETFADDRLEAFQASSATRKTEAEAKTKLENEHRAAQARLKVAEDKLKIAEQPRTKEQVLADVVLVPELKTLLDRQAAAEAEEREGLVKQLKGVGANTEDELKAMGIEQLKTLAKYAKVQAADFSGRGVAVPRTAQNIDEFAPPDPYKPGLAAMRGEKVN